MTLNGGLGDVVTTVKNKVLMTDVTEFICPAPGPDCRSSWLVAKQQETYDYHAFKIDADGVHDVPVITPNIAGSEAHFMFSADGNTIASTGTSLMVGKFNKNTGEIHDCIATGIYLIGPPDFSPDKSKLYVGYSHISGVGVAQVDLSLLPDITALQNSVVELDPIPGTQSDKAYTYTRLGPDGKIYLLRIMHNPDWVDEICRIDFPNIAGAGCNFIANVFGIPSWALYNDAFSSFPRTVFINRPDTVYHTADSFLCTGETIQLSSSSSNGSYIWNTGVTNRSIETNYTGKYWVKSSDACGMVIDSFNVLPMKVDFNLSNDTLLCQGSVVKLSVSNTENGTVLWNNGATTNDIEVDKPGMYYVSVTNKCGTFSDSITVAAQDCRCIPFIPNAFSPNGDQRNDAFGVELNCPGLLGFDFDIYNRFGQRVFHTQDPSEKWNGIFNKKPSDVGTYFYYLTLHKPGDGTVSFKGDLTLLR